MNVHSYSTLKKRKATYSIMLLHDIFGLTFEEITQVCQIPLPRVMRKYKKIKTAQAHLYIGRVSAALGHASTAQVKKEFEDAFACYRDVQYACAYLEKKYLDLLNGYRAGEPGMPPSFLNQMPPLILTLSEETVGRIIRMHDDEKVSFQTIGTELHITAARAEYAYRLCYRQTLEELYRQICELRKEVIPENKYSLWISF